MHLLKWWASWACRAANQARTWRSGSCLKRHFLSSLQMDFLSSSGVGCTWPISQSCGSAFPSNDTELPSLIISDYLLLIICKAWATPLMSPTTSIRVFLTSAACEYITVQQNIYFPHFLLCIFIFLSHSIAPICNYANNDFNKNLNVWTVVFTTGTLFPISMSAAAIDTGEML